MNYAYTTDRRGKRAAGHLGARVIFLVLAVLLLLLPRTGRAQAPGWSTAVVGSTTQRSGSSQTMATALADDANVVVVGYFSGEVAFGSTVLNSVGNNDLFVAKYSPAMGSWQWAQSGGGTGDDRALAVTVRNGSIYLTGYIANTTTNSSGVLLGGTSPATHTATQYGASTGTFSDVLVAKYTDNGTSATLNWTQVAGGTSNDQGNGIAVLGTSVYVATQIVNNRADANRVRFGGSGTTAGTYVQQGGSTGATGGFNWVVAKYTDMGASATLGWTQHAGGNNNAFALGVTASASGVYVIGRAFNTSTNTNSIFIGGTGTTAGTRPLTSTGSSANYDMVVAKYTDNGATATLGWVTGGGGTGNEVPTAIVAEGNRVYVTGNFTNNQGNSNTVLFGTVRINGASTTSVNDMLLLRYTDNGATVALNWNQVGGGTGNDQSTGLAVRGTSVYLAGVINTNAANANAVVFGGSGTTAGTRVQPGSSPVNSSDLLVARYTDNTTAAVLNWTQVAGGEGLDQGMGLAVASTDDVYVGGFTGTMPAIFGTAQGSPVGAAPITARALVATLLNTTTSGSWQQVGHCSTGGGHQVTATALDEQGNVFVVGYFSGEVAFGSTVLSSVGGNDFFLAKFSPATGSWQWAQSGGGTNDDRVSAVTVRGSTLYLTGGMVNTITNSFSVLLGGTGPATHTATQHGTSATSSQDLLVASYTDHGTSATLNWTQVAGGSFADQGLGLAARGTSLYVAGYLTNSNTNAAAVLLGGSGTTPGTQQQYGAAAGTSQDAVLLKYTDNGASATLVWSQAGGGVDNDAAQAVAFGSDPDAVYVTGNLTNTRADATAVRFGSSGVTAGTQLQYGASTSYGQDILLVKYVDAGATSTVAWTQVAGGTSLDQGRALVVQGTDLFLAGSITNTTLNTNEVVFGGSGTTAGTRPQYGANADNPINATDVLVAKYVDAGAAATVAWTQVAGGTSLDQATALAVRGSKVVVAGSSVNDAANTNAVLFGGSGTTAGTRSQAGVAPSLSADMLVACYTDAGTSATLDWTQVGGGAGGDIATSVLLSGSDVLVGGYIMPAATFGSVTVTSPASGQTTGVVGTLSAALPLPVELTQFTARLEGPTAVRLSWATASEVNSAAFVGERSLDGRTFTALGTVAAAGSSAAPRHYTLLDGRLPAGVPVLYYRLKQVDQDGTFSYSSVQVVAQTAALQLFPNPSADGAATLTGAAPDAAITVLDMLGRPVLRTTTDATGTARLQLPAARPAGLYLVQCGRQVLRLAAR